MEDRKISRALSIAAVVVVSAGALPVALALSKPHTVDSADSAVSVPSSGETICRGDERMQVRCRQKGNGLFDIAVKIILAEPEEVMTIRRDRDPTTDRQMTIRDDGHRVRSGRVMFRNLPPGKYLFEALECDVHSRRETCCLVDGDCDDGEDCTLDTCDPDNHYDNQVQTTHCVHEFQAQAYADMCLPYDLPGPPMPNLADILCVLDDFADGRAVDGCNCDGFRNTTDLHPCPEDGGGDGILGIDDIIKVLDAFGGLSPCDDPCLG